MAFDTSVFERIVRVNVLGGVWACKYALPHMLARGMGAILFTSSPSAFAGDVGQFSYGASKALVYWYIKTIATTFGKQGILCNGIVPGLIQTPALDAWIRSEEHTSGLQSEKRISYAVFCLRQKIMNN